MKQTDRLTRTQLFVIFLNVRLTLCYDYMCSETEFTQEKVNFHATSRIPNSSSHCCCPPDDHLQEAGPSFWQPRKGHDRCIFETPHYKTKWVSKNRILMKKGSKFSHLLTVRADQMWKLCPIFSIEFWFLDTKNTFDLIVRGLKNAFCMSLTPLLYHYPTILWQSSTKQ